MCSNSGSNARDGTNTVTGSAIPPRFKDDSDNASTMAIRHGHTGPYDHPADDSLANSTPQAGSYEPTGATDASRSFPLSGGQTSPASYPDPTTAARPADMSSTHHASTQHPESQSNLGRNTALGAGAGAADLNAYEVSRDRSDVTAPTDISSYDGSAAPQSFSQNTRGPHATFTANRLDPHVPGEFPSADGEDPHKISGVGFGTPAAPVSAGYGENELPASNNGLKYPSTSEDPSRGFEPSLTGSILQEPSNQHHYGRDAALAGGVGVAGIGAYELGKNREGPQPTGNMQPSGGVYPTPTTVEQPMSQSSSGNPYGSGEAMGSPVPSGLQRAPSSQYSQPPPDATEEGPTSNHHYGRDAALLGGAGAAGYGAYKLGQDRNNASPAAPDATFNPDNVSIDTGMQPGRSEQVVLMGQPTAQSGTSTVPHANYPIDEPHQPVEPERSHHYGRGAVLAGGAGAAGYGAHEYSQNRGADRDPTSSAEPSASTAGPTVTANEYPSTEPEREHQYGRDAALAGGAGAAGYGAYQYGKNRNVDRDPNFSDPNTAGPSSVASTTFAPQKAKSNEYPPTEAEKDHDYGRNAAIVGGAGAAGAAGYGANQYYDDKQHDADVANDAKLENERAKAAEKAEKQHEKEVKAAEKEQHKHEKEAKEAEKKHDRKVKAAEKEKHDQEKAAKEAEKQHEKEQKQHDKDEKKHAAAVATSDKEDKKHQREAERQKHEEEKERYKRNEQLKKEEKEKNPSFLHKMLHPSHHHGDVDKTAEDETKGASTGTVGAAGAAATSYRGNSADEPRNSKRIESRDTHKTGNSSGPQHIRQPGEDEDFESQHGHEGPGKYQHGHGHENVKTATDEKGHARLHKEPPGAV